MIDDKNWLANELKKTRKSRKWVYVGSGVGICFLIVLAMFLVTSAKSNKSVSLSSDTTPNTTTEGNQPSYAFAYLGSKCQQGINTYNQLITSLTAQNTQIYNITQQSVASFKSEDASMDANDNAIIANAKSAYNQAEASGNSTEAQADFETEMNVNNQMVSGDTTYNNDEINTQELAVSQMETSTNKIQSDKTAISQLTNCVNMVNSQQNFTESEINNINSLLPPS